MHQHISDFLLYLGSEKGLSPHTLKAYGRDVAAFCCKHGDVLDFLRRLKEEGYATSSICRALVAVKMFFRFLKREGLIEKDPTLYLDSPKLWQLIPEVLTTDEVTKLLAMPDCTEALGMRDKAMLQVMYASGLRVSEMCGLNITDVDDTFVRVKGKGNKERIVPIAKSAVEAIDDYLHRFRQEAFRSGRHEDFAGPGFAALARCQGCDVCERRQWMDNRPAEDHGNDGKAVGRP